MVVQQLVEILVFSQEKMGAYPSTLPSWWLSGKEFACNAGDPELIPGLGKSPGEGNGNPLQYSCLENSMDKGAWRAIVHGVTKSQIQPSE